MDREIGPLPRAVNGKETQRDDPHLVKMRVGGTKKFAGDFRSRIRADRLGEMKIFRERDFLADTVDRGTRREDKALDAGVARRFEQMQRAADIGIVVKLRLIDGRPDASTRRQMGDRVKFFAMEKQVHRGAVAQIDPMDGNVPRNGRDIRLFGLRIVKVVEIVENRDFVAGRE